MSPTAVTAPMRKYRGRFAPSPSGPLHFGSLVAAVGSYLDAKANKGKWLVRIEDIDTTRVIKNADTDILNTLQAYALYWDEPVVYQTQRLTLYQEIIDSLLKQQLVYGCNCTRKQIKALGGIYQGHCKSLNNTIDSSALRLTQCHAMTQFNDLIQGDITVNTALAHEDYLIKRSDGLFAYQLVVVVDDIEQGINRVVRGADLIEPTARQISLFKQLNAAIPEFAHLPLAVAEPGFKLSKQNYAPAISKSNPKPALISAFEFLGLPTHANLMDLSIEQLMAWGVDTFSLKQVPRVPEIQISQHPTSQVIQFTLLSK
ncbi:tRNA glutamyl-Q(34) synthetase GluQRS [Pseudoalteromonas sp. SG45-5]|uniref:tRNA glutamyl-Q(34) synthetase GluQRS n=1 Tax=unclassified Pseudoalteromonas TaxID=194690 RepID=UPI0015FE7209|nr:MULTISPECIES: tRNA glutamyl-Q(34) synthetase GluQRS [unclassified Pseudoalteromonas]MBB1385378.1 tRNA glutamyl-Q(34) synthetase GluQRS [Pseudoalteromonas sp. SG45-5]MBB1393304.1 tRNA glutamyl-Q(34) synthetase GluQRS [Pseudoalteromonas sp. SG44-4]MBB1446569.1 tRNA glutamyl-Q(34) synthetase GluQRS [Pseudoalteromonas sp. SG41-6]